MKPATITLDRDLVLELARSAWWPCCQFELQKVIPNNPTLVAQLAEDRQHGLDDWLGSIGERLAPTDATPEGFLNAVVKAWSKGSRPGGT